jgi:hypothetical protein
MPRLRDPGLEHRKASQFQGDQTARIDHGPDDRGVISRVRPYR